jgi:hypothetical protein
MYTLTIAGVRVFTAHLRLFIMDQYFRVVNRFEVARRVMRLVFRLTRPMLRMLLRRPVIDILFVMFVLWILATLIGTVNQPQPLLRPTPPILFEGR